MLAAALLVLGALFPQDQAQVHATLSDERIAVGATTMLQVSVEVAGGQPESIQLPLFPAALDVLSSREYQQTQLSLPGGRTTIVRRDIVLRARAEGLFVIDPITIRLPGGAVQHTRPLTLRVVAATPGAPMPPGVRRPFGGSPAEAGTLQVTASPDTAWLGEPVLLRMTARIPEEQRTRRGRSPIFEPPTAVGFWVQEIEDRGSVGVRVAEGRYYDIHEYRRFYVPLTAGERVLPPGRAVYEVDRGWMFAPQSYELVGDSVRLYVRSLPERDRPASFTGAVGSFEVRADVDRTQIVHGDAATLTVEIEGTGNIRALPAPHLAQMPGIEVFDPSEDAAFVARSSGISGSKTFRWILTPDAPGTYALPDVTYAWFDPETERYDSVRIQLPALEVGGVVARASAPRDTALAPIRPFPAGVPSFAWARSTPFALAQALPILLIAAVSIWRRQAPRIAARRRRRRRMHADFSGVRARATVDPRGALAELQRALDGALAALVAQEDAIDEEAALRARGAGKNVLASLRSLRAAIYTMRFRREPVGPADVDALVRRADVLLGRLTRATRSRRTAAVAVVLPLLLFVSGSHGSAVQQSDFADAVAAYERAEYDVAGTGFRAYLAKHPHDAAAWYDLGNAEYRRAAGGAAVHAWARAVQLEPRAADARHNLRLAGAGHILETAGGSLPLTANELMGWAGMLWLTGGTLLGLRFLLRHRTARVVAGVVAVAALGFSAIALLGLAARSIAPDHAIVMRAAALRAAPGLHAEAWTELGEGVLVRIVGSRDSWLHVRRGTDEGWVERRDVGLLE